MHIHNLIGIGFGPSNIALAIALEEQADSKMDAFFIEKQTRFAWHPDMLLSHAHMQISFMKDLVTLRNPASRYTFINYLHSKHRLLDFINLKTFYPSRHEFNDYLAWAADKFASICAYGEEVLEVLPEMHGKKVTLLRVRSRHQDGRIEERLARSLVISVGGAPNIPEAFAPFRHDTRIFHSSQYLSKFSSQNAPKRVAVIGAGQSAAEIFLDLQSRGGMQVDLITRARCIKPSDDSPFVNEIFNPEYTDYIYNLPNQQRTMLLDEFMNTNYAAPDQALIEQIYNVFYKQKVAGQHHHRFLRSHKISQVTNTGNGIRLDLNNIDTGSSLSADYDAIVLATGYVRDIHRGMLAPIAEYLGEFCVDRRYRIATSADFMPSIYLQGCCEPTHGLSDTLLSVTAIRTEEIAKELHSSAFGQNNQAAEVRKSLAVANY